MKQLLAWGLGLLVIVLLAGAASAQFARTEDAIKYRQSVMTVIGAHFSRMGAVVMGDQPYTQEAFQHNADLVAGLIGQSWEAFMVPGSDRGSRLKAEALTQKERFMELATANEAELVKLAEVAKTGDLDAIKSQFGAAGASCKACHDLYRGR